MPLGENDFLTVSVHFRLWIFPETVSSSRPLEAPTPEMITDRV